MATFGKLSLFLLSSLISISALKSPAATAICGGSCGDLEIRFPFKLTNQPDRCGYPGFNLSCNKNTETILSLPFSGDFSVENIDYASQTIRLNDPDSCIPKRLLNSFTLNASPFQELFPQNYTFLNCSSDNATAAAGPVARPVDCLSGGNYTVVSVPTNFYGGFETGLGCSVIATVLAPVNWSDPSFGVALVWKEPDCRSCERDGGSCKFSGESGLEVGCSGDHYHGNGLSRGAKNGILGGVGVLAILCLVGFIIHLNKSRNQRQPTIELAMPTSRQPPPVVIAIGLDGPTIESYPKTILGQSRRLPDPNHNTCSICLSEYQARDVLRTIPQCKHYFHADCIDEWLRLNSSCPMCRNSLGEAIFVTSSIPSCQNSTGE